MRKTCFLLTMMLLAFVLPKAKADVVENYVYDFEGLSTASHSFAPQGWGHIEASYFDYDSYETYYVKYTAIISGGSDDGAYLSIGSQTLGSGWNTQTVTDMLVTPAVTGKVSLDVKLRTAGGKIKFYSCTKGSNGKFSAGGDDVIEVDVPELAEDSWATVEFDAPENTYVGICGDNVAIDQFKAASADITFRKELTINTVKAVWTKDYLDANAEGNASLEYKVVVKNTGETKFEPGAENYSLSIVNYSKSNEVLGTTPINQTLEPGATSDELTVTATFPIAEATRNRFDIKENINGTTKAGTWYDLIMYEPNLVVTLPDKGDALPEGSTFDFGVRNTEYTLSLDIANKGAAPAQLTAVNLPEGFTCKLIDKEDATIEYTIPCEIPAHAKYRLNITMGTTVPGPKSGNLTFVIGDEEISYVVAGNVLDPSKWYVNFDDEKYPDGSYLESTNWSITEYGVDGNLYHATNSNSTDLTKFISPKLTVAEGEVLSFRANARSTYSQGTLNVYYSTDRKNWTLVRTLSTSADNEEDKILKEKESAYPNPMKLKPFTVTGIPAGECYIAFEAGYVGLDDISGFTVAEPADFDFVTEDVKIEPSAMVNHEYKASMTFGNAGVQNIAAQTFTANLKVNGEIVASAPVAALERDSYNRNTTAKVSLVWTPRNAGTFPIAIELTNGTYTYKEEATVTVAAENALGYVAVGKGTGTGASAPMSPNYKQSDCEMVYTADLINLPEGTPINKIMFRGYKTSDPKLLTSLKVWMANTEDATPASTGTTLVDVTSMTSIYDGEYTIEKVGGSESDLKEVLVFDMSANPFVYSGKNLRVVVSARSDVYKNNSFETTDDSKTCLQRRKDSGDLSTSTFDAAYLPVMNVFVERPVYHVSGTVVKKSDETEPVSGATVTLKADNVEYSAVTAINGKYSIDVYQPEKDYTVTVAKEGYFPYESAETVNVLTGSIEDYKIVFAEAKGFKLLECNIPAETAVNSTYTATAKVLNGATKLWGGYEANLYVNGEVVATADDDMVNANAEAEFTFTYTPHAAGAVKAYIEFVVDDVTTTSEQVDVTIAEETGESLVIVGSPNSTGSAPAYTNYDNSDAEIVYPAELIGLDAGTPIKGVSFKGYNTAGARAVKLEAWIANTTDPEITSPLTDLTSTEGMTKIYDDMWTCEMVGTQGNEVDLLSIDMTANPFVYEGNNVRVIVRMSKVTDTFKRSSFLTDKTHKGAMRSKDGAAPAGQLNTTEMPVAYFSVDPYKTVSGTVTLADTQAPVAGETVTVKSEGVEYYGTTDENGAYSVNVIQYGRDYVASVSHEGYLPNNVAVSFANGNVENADIALNKGFIKGQVIDVTTEEPIPGAYVELADRDYNVLASLTTEDGSFNFPVDAPGTYDLWAEMDGYIFHDVDAAEVTTEGVTANIYLAPRAYDVSGAIFDEEGEVLTGVTVTLKKDGEVVATKENSSEFGDYLFETITGVTTHVYTVEASKAGYLTASITLDFSTVGAWNIMLLDQNIVLKKGFIKGQVLDTATNEPIAGAYIELCDEDFEVVDSATSEDGSFNFPVDKAGVYDLWAQADGYTFAYADEAEVTTEGITANIYMTPRAFDVSGAVTDEEGEVLTGVTVTLKKDGEVVESKENSTGYGDYLFEGLTGVTKHEYTIEAAKAGYLTASITLDFSAMGQWDMMLSDQNIVLKKGFIKGQVLDTATNEPIAGAYIELCDEDFEVVDSATSEDGSFNFPVDKAGVYDLWAQADGYTFAYADAAEVTDAGITANIYMTPRAFDVSGAVYDGVESDATILTGVTVTLKKDGEVVETKENSSVYGDYLFEGLTGVTKHVYTVEAEKEGYAKGSITLDFSAMGLWDMMLSDQNIILTPNAGVDGLGANDFKAFGGDGMITVITKARVIDVYNEAGVLMRSVKVEDGKTVLAGFNTGVYVVNGVKVAVK